MDYTGNESGPPSKIGDRLTSDVVVRLRIRDGRDEWLYCHSHVLTAKSEYFSDRLSEDWPTCQIIDSRNCVEVYCQESNFDYFVTVLRFLYVSLDGQIEEMWHGVKNALGILQVAVELGCPHVVTACATYLEAVPWEEAEEEEILKIIPGMGSEVDQILARLKPVNPSAIERVFLSAIQLATSSPPPQMNDLKSSAQEQLEYMLTEDDDAPLLVPDTEIKFEVNECVKRLFSRFRNLVESLLHEPVESFSEAGAVQLFLSHLSDLSWACQILTKLEIMRDFVYSWIDASDKIIKAVEAVEQTSPSSPEIIDPRVKVIEVAAKVLEVIGYGTVIMPTAKRLHMVKIWLPFTRITKPIIDALMTDGEDDVALKMDGELWPSLESTFVSVIVALPSVDQADILTEWFQNEHIRYPDLTEAFEVWSYRSKVAKRRLAMVGGNHGMANML